MYVCVYVICMYVDVGVCKYASMYVCAGYGCKNICACRRVCIYDYNYYVTIYAFTRVYTWRCACICVYKAEQLPEKPFTSLLFKYVYICVRAYTYAYIYHMHLNVCVYTGICDGIVYMYTYLYIIRYANNKHGVNMGKS